MPQAHHHLPGLPIAKTLRPTTVQDLSDMLRSGASSGANLVPIGGGRSLGTGQVVDEPVTGIDLTAMSGIISYEPADLTLSVSAGTRVVEVQEELARHGQELPLDVPFPADATIGGLVATGFAGPRRLRSGSLRDLLIGCEYVRGDGLLAKAGGMVVKNVSGFEIPRMLHGSWGSLAVIASVNLKVMPAARHEATWLFRTENAEDGAALIQDLLQRFPHIDAATTLSETGGATNQVRFLGRKASVDESIAECRRTVRDSEGTVLERDISQKFWQEAVESTADQVAGLVVAISVRPSQINRTMSDLGTAMDDLAEPAIHVSPGTGVIRVTVRSDAPDLGAVQRLLEIARSVDRRAVIETAPLDIRRAVPVWGPTPDGIEIMRAIKLQFDPSGVLNRGRLLL